jgi:hypothetical protein
MYSAQGIFQHHFQCIKVHTILDKIRYIWYFHLKSPNFSKSRRCLFKNVIKCVLTEGFLGTSFSQSVSQSVSPFISPSVRPSVRLLVCLSICLSVHLSVCTSLCLSICLSICLSVYLSVCLSVHLSVSPTVHRCDGDLSPAILSQVILSQLRNW